MFGKHHLLLLGILLTLPLASQAAPGGPFDNGDYNQQLDETGIYQATLRFSNGQGYCQFGSNVGYTNYLAPTATVPQNPTAFGRVTDRSVIYYKGVTYLGSCSGMVDMTAKLVQGVTNGSSDVSGSTTTTTTGGFNAGTQLVNNGGHNLTCNSAWTAKIYQTRNVLKFKGSGSLSVVPPADTTAISAAISTLLGLTDGAYLPPVQTNGTTTNVLGPANNGEFDSRYFNNIMSGVSQLQSLYTPNPDTIPISVYGTRKYFYTFR